MSSILLLNLRHVDDACAGEWLLWNTESGCATEQGTLSGVVAEDADNIQKLASLSRQWPCFVLVPGESVSQFQVSLPVSGAAARAALPYQIEDKLACELDQVHLAYDNIKAGKPVTVWVVDHALMRGWHQWLQNAEIRVRKVIPDYAAIRAGVMVAQRAKLLLSLPGNAFSFERELFDAWRALHSGKLENIDVVAVGDAEVPEGMPPVKSRARGYLEALAENFVVPNVSLCQGQYALQDIGNDLVKQLRWPAIAAGLVLVLHWALLSVGAMQYSAKARQLDAAADEVYLKTFPQARKVVNARSQMKSQLKAMEGSSGDAGLLPLLSPVAKAFRDQNNIAVTQLVFQGENRSLRLEIDAENYAAVDSFSQKLTAAQLAVSRGSFRQNGERVSGQLIISPAG